jgi:hypothetical protein
LVSSSTGDKKMPKLVCKVCGSEHEVPTCCDKSMIVKEGYLLCCCNTETCGYQAIPECCGITMEYFGD